MKFVNNWMQPVTLAAGATTLAVALADGEYRLTLADDDADATRWEVIAASVAGGSATLQRGQEGTADQTWPSGSVIYGSVTAGWLNGMDTRVTALEQAGGGGGAVVSTDGPRETPSFAGQIHVKEGLSSYVALASNNPEDWALFAGFPPSFSYVLQPGSPGVAYQIQRYTRKIRVRSDPESLPEGFPVTLLMPAWEGFPYGWSLYVEVNNIALNLDFSALGSPLSCRISDFETGTTASLNGAVLTLRNIRPVSMVITDIEPSDDGAYCSLELREYIAPTVNSYEPEE